MQDSNVPQEIFEFSAAQGLTFLEHLAHQLTISVRVAAEDRPPIGSLTDKQSRQAMYWANEANHNVVQLVRNLRIGREEWNAATIAEWVTLWCSYRPAQTYNRQAVALAIYETLHPYRPEGQADG